MLKATLSSPAKLGLFVLPAMAVLSATAVPAYAETAAPTAQAKTAPSTVSLSVYYGSGALFDAQGNLVTSLDAVEVTTRISSDLAGQIANDPNVSPVVSTASVNPIASWAAFTDFVLLTAPQSLPAANKLDKDLTFKKSKVVFDTGNQPMGTETYCLSDASLTGVNLTGANGCPPGQGEAIVSYFERDIESQQS